MDAQNFETTTSPCGLDCFNCEVFESNITHEVKTDLSTRLGIDIDQVSCRGCRVEDGCRLHGSCSTLDCIKEKGFTYCYECDLFPCEKLQPSSQMAERFPHNMKVYNLCRIKSVGLPEWAQNEAGLIRKRYFKGKFILGTGPVLD